MLIDLLRNILDQLDDWNKMKWNINEIYLVFYIDEELFFKAEVVKQLNDDQWLFKGIFHSTYFIIDKIDIDLCEVFVYKMTSEVDEILYQKDKLLSNLCDIYEKLLNICEKT